MIPLFKVDRTYRHLQRLREILALAVRYGFEDVVAETRLRGLVKSLRLRIDPAVMERSRWERIRMLLEGLGPTFVKFGQLLSNRPDLVPPPLLKELGHLQDRVAPFPFEEVEAILERAWNRPWREVLESLDPVPVAAASMAQVHSGVLRDGGARVAIKVRRPRIPQIVEADLEILQNFAAWADGRFDAFRSLHLLPVVAEFDQNVRQEIDFRVEASHLRRFAERYGGEPTLRVPRLYSDLSNGELIVQEFVEGIKISEVDALRAAGYDLPRLARVGSDLVLRQIFDSGFFHADPHPGNLLVLPGERICFLDFGSVGNLSVEQQECLADLLVALEERNSRGLARALQRMSSVEAPDLQLFRADVDALLLAFGSVPSSELDVGKVFAGLTRLLSKHRVQVHPVYFLLLKALVSLEGISRRLDPEYDVVREIEPFVRKLVLRRFRPDVLARGLADDFGDAAVALRGLPDEALALARQTRRGELKIRFQHGGLDGLRSSIRDSADRMGLAIVLSSLLISSSLVLHAGLPPLVRGMPILGLLGFVSAAALALFLLVTALFRRR